MNRQNQIAKIRNFNRFYLERFHTLNEKLNSSHCSYTEIMVLDKLSQRNRISISELAYQLDFSKGYLSQVISKLERCGLVERQRYYLDNRSQLISLTLDGHSKWIEHESNYSGKLERFISELSDEKLEKLLDAMLQIHEITKTYLSVQIKEGAD